MTSGPSHDASPGLPPALLFEVGLQRLDADPIKTFKFASPDQKAMAQRIHEAEVLFRAGNSSGKTWGGAGIGVAMARGLKWLDGVELPDLGIPNTGWVLSQSYKQQVDAAQAAYRHWIGNWPHKIGWVSGPGKGYIDSIWLKTRLCRHGMDQVCPNCSKIVFHCEESQSTVGGRIDWAHGDEPPSERIWREIRSRKRAGRPFIRFITATPLERERWEWLARDFQSCDTEIKNGRFEIRSSLLRNKFITQADRKHFQEAWAGDPLIEARMKGDYVDSSGSCPFNYKLLQRWRERCCPPLKKAITVKSQREGISGKETYDFEAEVEIWEKPDENEKYLIVCDPSLGIDDGHHDPSCIHVIARRKPRLVLRYNGYLPAYGLGSLAGHVATAYNKGFIDVDTSGGYGENVLTALADMRYGRIVQDMDPDRPGVFSPRLGFKLSRATRNELVGQIQQALVEDSIRVWSTDVIDCFMQMRMVAVPGGWKYEPAPGQHDEDMICLGRALAVMAMPGYRLSAEKDTPLRDRRNPMQKFRDVLTGRVTKSHRGKKPIQVAENWR